MAHCTELLSYIYIVLYVLYVDVGTDGGGRVRVSRGAEKNVFFFLVF